MNSNAFKLIIASSSTDLYFSSVCNAWFALVSILDISSKAYFLSPLYTVIIFLLWVIAITIAPVCFATLSAVLCLVPVSDVGID